MKLSIIIPVYNEEGEVKETIEKIKKLGEHEIIAVNDCSKDKSGEILDEIEGIKVIHHPINKGYSASLKTGIKASKGEWIAITDADGTYPVEDIPKLLEHTNNYDMVVGARTGEKVSIPLLRKPAKWFLNKVANYVASQKIPDINSGLRIFKKELAMEFWKLYPQRFSFTITITMASITSGYNVKFIPINYYQRKGKSTIHPIKDFIGFNRILLKMMLFFKPLKVFIPVSIIMFLIGIGLFLAGIIFLRRIYDITLVMITLSAVQVFILGLVAELIIRRGIR